MLSSSIESVDIAAMTGFYASVHNSMAVAIEGELLFRDQNNKNNKCLRQHFASAISPHVTSLVSSTIVIIIITALKYVDRLMAMCRS